MSNGQTLLIVISLAIALAVPSVSVGMFLLGVAIGAYLSIVFR